MKTTDIIQLTRALAQASQQLSWSHPAVLGRHCMVGIPVTELRCVVDQAGPPQSKETLGWFSRMRKVKFTQHIGR